MTVGEFQAWLDGMSENMRGVPTKKQWERIKEKLAEVYEQKCSGCNHYHPWTYTTTTPSSDWTITNNDLIGCDSNNVTVDGTSCSYTTNAGENQ